MAFKDFLRSVFFFVSLQIATFGPADAASPQVGDYVANDPIIYYTTTELVCSEGYPVQEHKVVTDDGYVLTVHRVPKGRTRAKVPHSKNHYHKIHLNHHPDFDECLRESLNETSTGLPVLFVHGALMASDGWFLQGPGNDLAYILADNGYDVWAANVRGNFYSRKHKTLSPSSAEFWDFSYHENGVLDIPAVIDYILKVTKKDKVGYVGISMGTTIFFAMTSMRPEYNDKILGFVAFAPVAFMKEENMNPRRKMLFSAFGQLTVELNKRSNVHELFPKTRELVQFAKIFCSRNNQLQDFCYDFVSVFVGYHSKLVLRSKFPLYITHFPTGISLKTFLHYLQNIKGNNFKLYDYGVATNLKLYKQATPPDYPLWNITAPVALYYTDGDFFYSVKDIELLLKLLPNVVDAELKRKFNHVDFLWSYNAKDILYPKTLSFFNRLNNQYYLESRKKKSITTERSDTDRFSRSGRS